MMIKSIKENMAISFSGAATAIPALIAHAENITANGEMPKHIAGISSGTLTALALAFNKLEEAKTLALNLQFKDIFGVIPVNKKGKISIKSGLRFIFKGALGDSLGLKNTLEKFITKDEWLNFQKYSKIQVHVGVYNCNLNNFELILINLLSYEDMLLYCTASCTIPIYCDAIQIKDCKFWDGGLCYHNASVPLLEAENSIKELHSVYSRPEYLYDYDLHFTGKSAGRNISKTMETMVERISYLNSQSEKAYCESLNIKLKQYYSPKVLKGLYDIDQNRLLQLYSLTKNSKT